MAIPMLSRVPLSERMRPTRLDGLVGNVRALTELRRWAERWREAEPSSHRAAVLAGPPGVGKTSAAVALAAEMGWTLIEMNASDARNQAAIERVAGRASISHTLTSEPTGPVVRRALILLDEADCLTGRAGDASRAPAAPPPLGEFLRGRYGTVEALNAAWGLGTTPRLRPFSDWSAVPNSPGNFAWARLAASRRDIDDWRGSARVADLSDRGGLATIVRLIRATRQPILLTVNDERALTRYSAAFRSSATWIRFYPIRPDELLARLSEIARTEGILLAPGCLPAIVARAQGDLRAALNDLEAIAPLPPGPLQLEVLGGRDRTSDFAGLTSEALSARRFYRAGEVRDRLDAPPDDLLPWIEENIAHYAPSPMHRDRAFRTLAIAEQFLSRARRYRTYGLWSYASELLTGGVGVAIRDRPVPVSGEASFPQFLWEMGRSRSTRAVRESVVAKLGRRYHLSRQKARALMLPDMEGIFVATRGRSAAATDRQRARTIALGLQLSAEEVGFLLGTSPDAPEVTGILGPSAEDDGGTPAKETPSEAPYPKGRGSSEPATEPAARPPKKRVQRSLGEYAP